MGISTVTNKYSNKTLNKQSDIDRDLKACMKCKFFWGNNHQCSLKRCYKENKKPAVPKNIVKKSECDGCTYRQSERYCLPDNVIKSKETVLGCYALADLSNGDYIINSKVSKTPSAENAYLFHLDGSRQAISITLKSFAKGLSGKLEQGDIVSVIAPDYKKQGATVIPPEIRYVEVISVTTASGYDANTGEQKKNSKEEKELPSTVTLLVTPEQGNVLASLEAEGECHLSLVYRGESKNAKKFLDVQEEALETLYPEEKLVGEFEESTQTSGSEKASGNTKEEEGTQEIEIIKGVGMSSTTDTKEHTREHTGDSLIQSKDSSGGVVNDDLGHAEEE